MDKHKQNMGFATRLVGLLTVFAILMSLSLTLNHRLLGHKTEISDPAVAVDSTMTELPDGSLRISTSALGADVEGYAGATPLQIDIKDGKILKITPLPNDETPSFFNEAFGGLVSNWQGKSVEEAKEIKVDAVSGATYSSDAIIENVSRALVYYDKHIGQADSSATDNDKPLAANPGWWCALIVAIAAAVLPIFIHNKTYRTIQLALNVGVLGFWTGTFLSYTVFNSLISGPLRLSMLPAWILLVTAFILPLFRKTNHFCTWVCPLGSAQQLAGMVVRHKPHLSPTLVKALVWMRRIIWGLLMLALWSGLWLEWIDYELFTAFIISSATPAVLWTAAGFILLSLIVDRPFCRFVCPVGTIINIPIRNN